jgi:hypothetical protein
MLKLPRRWGPAESAATGDADYDVFISYSRKDASFAVRLQKALSRFRPSVDGVQRPPLRVFLDQDDIYGVDYFKAVEDHLGRSRKLVVVCSPGAVASTFVDDEIERFLKHRTAADLVPVLWRGEPNNEVPSEDPRRAFPSALMKALELPLAIDYRALDDRRRPDAADHRSAWIGLLANLLDRPRAEIEQREARRRRNRLLTWTGAGAALLVVVTALAIWALLEGERALARQLAARAALPGGLDPPNVARRGWLAREAAIRLARRGESALDGDTPLRAALAQSSRRVLALPTGVQALAFVPDGRHLLVAEAEGLREYSLATGIGSRQVTLPSAVRQVEALPDLRHIATLDEQGRVGLFSWPGLRPLPTLPHELTESAVHCLGVDGARGTLLALRISPEPHQRAELLRWEPGASKLLSRASAELPKSRSPWKPAEPCLRTGKGNLAHEALALVTGGPADANPLHTALLWSLAHPNPFMPGPMPAVPVRIEPGVAHASLDSAARLRAVDGEGATLEERGIPKDQRSRRVQLVPPGFAPIALSDDAQWLLVSRVAHDPYVPLLRSTHFQVISTLTGHPWQDLADQVGTGTFTPDGKFIATVSGERVRLWDRRGGAELQRLVARGKVVSVRFDEASRHAVAKLADGRIDVFALGDAEAGAGAPPRHALAALGTADRAASGHGNQVLIAQTRDRTPVVIPVDGRVGALQASPDGRWLAVVVWPPAPAFELRPPSQGELLLLDTGSEPRVHLRIPAVRQHRFDADSTHLASLAADGTLGMVQLSPAPRALWQKAGGPRVAEAALALSGGGRLLAVGTTTGLRIYEGRTGRVVRDDIEPVANLALSRDGSQLARAHPDGRLRIEQAAVGGRAVHLGSPGLGRTRMLMFSPGGQLLMGVGASEFGTFAGTRHSYDQQLGVWNAASGTLVERLPAPSARRPEGEDPSEVRSDEPRHYLNFVWNETTSTVAARVHPSALAYWTLPSERASSRLQAWRLGDQGLIEVFRTDNRLDESPQALEGSGALRLSGENGHQRLLDIGGQRLPDLACRWLGSPLDPRSWRLELGSLWRWPSRCPGGQ